MGSEREVLIVVDREREVLIVVDRERVAIVIMIKLAIFDAVALHRRPK